MAEVVKPRPADAGVGADRMPAVQKPALKCPGQGIVRAEELIGVAVGGQRTEHCTAGRAQQHDVRAGLAVGEVDGVRADVAPVQCQDLAAATPWSQRA